MKKALFWTLGGILGLLVIAYVVAIFFLGSFVRAGVNRYVPTLTKTPVTLDGARLSPFSGEGTLDGLFIGNPAGWTGAKAVSMKTIHLSVVPSSIFRDCIVVNDLTLEEPEVVYETKIVSSNIGDLLKNVQGSASEAPAAGAAQPTAKSGQPLKFIIKHFHMTGGRVRVGFGASAITLPLPPVTIDHLGEREGGITSSQLAVAVMRSMTSNVVAASTQAAGQIGSTMGAAAGNAAKSAGESLKNLFGGKNQNSN